MSLILGQRSSALPSSSIELPTCTRIFHTSLRTWFLETVETLSRTTRSSRAFLYPKSLPFLRVRGSDGSNRWATILIEVAEKVTSEYRERFDTMKYAFSPIRNDTDWKGHASYMLMLRDLSDLAKLEDLRESTNARDDIMQQYDHMSANTLYASFALANIYPLNWLENELKALHRGLFKRMHDGLEKAMFVVARAKDLEESFASVSLAYAYRTLADDHPAGFPGDRVKALDRRLFGPIEYTNHPEFSTNTPCPPFHLPSPIFQHLTIGNDKATILFVHHTLWDMGEVCKSGKDGDHLERFFLDVERRCSARVPHCSHSLCITMARSFTLCRQ